MEMVNCESLKGHKKLEVDINPFHNVLFECR